MGLDFILFYSDSPDTRRKKFTVADISMYLSFGSNLLQFISIPQGVPPGPTTAVQLIHIAAIPLVRREDLHLEPANKVLAMT